MNLIQQVNDLKRLGENLILIADKRSDGLYYINSWMGLSNTLNKLKDFSFLNEQVDEIFKIDDNVNIRINEWTTKAETYKKLSDKIETLKKSIESCVKLIDEYTNDDYEITEGKGLLNVKMPNNINMKKMSIICSDLDKVFNQCPFLEDEVKFIGVEKGSVYFVLATTIVSITVIGTLLKTALDVQRKFYLNEMMKNKLETMEGLTDSIKLIKEQLDNEVKEYCKQRAMQIEENKNLGNEEMERLVLSIKTLSKLIGEGVQMQYVLYENQKDSELTFPKSQDYENLFESIKMLK